MFLGKADPRLGGGEAGGIADIRGKNSYIETGEKGFMVQLGFHEIGRNLGLEHPSSTEEVGYSRNAMGYAPGSLNFSREQLVQMYDFGKTGRILNQGFNREVITNRVLGYNSKSTNIRPYRGERSFNMIIPKRVN